MSLINKMLQDLDARGTPAGESLPTQIRPVAPARARQAGRLGSRTFALAVAGSASLLAAAGWLGWMFMHQQKATTGSTAPPAAAATQASVHPPQGMASVITTGPVKAVLPMPPAPASAPAPAPGAASVTLSRTASEGAPASARPAPARSPAGVVPKTVVGYEPDSEEARAARQAILAELRSRTDPGHLTAPAPSTAQHVGRPAAPDAERRVGAGRKAAANGVHGAGAGDIPGRREPGAETAEGAYRRALRRLEDGRSSEALAALEQAVKIDPAHEAARQTLVGLLIESGRTEEALRQLKSALALDARQPALAMLLARLQIERGSSGVDTLMRTLPYAGNNADYRAFLAGALQREQRHREAVEHYQAALRGAPANGVWWMGLGMSLQAEHRHAEALDAFQRARASGGLSPELQGFVERRLLQLGR